MMQSLLADRFKLAVHFETELVPLFTLSLVKPGKTGSGLHPHDQGPACDTAATAPARAGLASDASVFPSRCDEYAMTMDQTGKRVAGSRNTTMALLADGLPSMARLDRPVGDETVLTGRFDFRIEWTPELERPATADVQPLPQGPTFLEALHDQLGLKLESTRGPLQVLVIDHVERPSEN